MNFYTAFIQLFVKLLQLNLFKYTLPVSTSIAHENIIEIPLTSRKRRQAKFYLVHAWSQAPLFTGEASFPSRFFFNNPKISTQTQKPTKYQSIIWCKQNEKKIVYSEVILHFYTKARSRICLKLMPFITLFHCSKLKHCKMC